MSRPLSDRGLWPGAETLPWEDDVNAQAVVDAFPEGMTLAQVGLCFGLNRERVRQIEYEALRKLVASGDAHDLLPAWAELQAAKDEHEDTWPDWSEQ